MDLVFVSRHRMTAAQAATLDGVLGPGGAYPRAELVLEDDRLVAQVRGAAAALGCRGDMVAGVFPTWAALELLRSGITVLEFANEASARLRGVFLCRGVWVHTLAESRFVPCPIPPAAQEESSLAPESR